MNSFKSSPLIQDHPRPRFAKKPHRASPARNSRLQDIAVANPFRAGEEENLLPIDLKQQLMHMDTLSSNQIQSINFNSTAGGRRASAFARHLLAMQSAAKKQEEMYRFYAGGKEERKEESCTEDLMQEQPMTIEEDDLSTGMRNCFFQLEQDPADRQPFNFFSEEPASASFIFYSQNCIYDDREGKDDLDAYFNV